MDFKSTTLVSCLLIGGVIYTSCKQEKPSVVNTAEEVKRAKKTSESESERPTTEELKVSNPTKEAEGNKDSSAEETPKFTHDWSTLRDSKVKWRDRVKFLQNLEYADLHSADVEELYKLIKHRPSSSAKRDQEGWFVVANEIMEQIRINDADVDKFNSSMLGFANDKGLNSVLRDYAVQHLGLSLLSGKNNSDKETNNQNMIATSGELVALIQDSTVANSSIPGTSLRVLVNMKQTHVSSPELDEQIQTLKPYFQDTLSQLTGAQGYSTLSPLQQVTAVSVINTVGQLGLKDHAASIRQLAQNTEIDPTLRLNSIATLGMLGSPEDESFLTELSTTLEGANARFRFAAQTALKNLKRQ